jgi:DNA-3-methyladenine glycosylase II
MLTKRVGRVTSRLLLCRPVEDKQIVNPRMQRIETLEHVYQGLDALCAADARLVRVRKMAGEVPLRLSEPGFRSLASIIVSQQVSRASADAIFGRLIRLVDPLDAEGVLAAGEDIFREAGLSRPKQRTLLAVADAVAHEELDLHHLCRLDPAEAMQALTAVHGIGAWTAEVYLLFAAGHPDIFPARDVALQTAVGHALAIDPRPGEKPLIKLAESWSPWRGVAARLFWAYYRETRGRDAAPVTEPPANPA